jgi:flagellar basal-body rod protein FlgF
LFSAGVEVEVYMIRAIQRLARDMSVKMLRQDVIANNLANATTPGFRTQRAFLSVLKSKIGAARGVQSDQAADIYTSFEQGPIEHTDRPLDLAINGDGFFVIDTALGERFTRCGGFTLTDAGLLATQAGDLVMGTSGPIAIEGQDISITPDGTVVVDSEEVGTLKVVHFSNPQELRREGNLYASGGQAHAEVDYSLTQIVQGALEGSNVNPIDEMVEMVAVHRGFESDQKGIKMLHESARELVQRVGDFGRS